MEQTKTKRLTKQRQVILEELSKVTSHPTAAELYEITRKRLPKISLATVYRNLEKLVAEGEALKIDHCGKESRFDADISRHCHIRCVECGKVGDAHDVPDEIFDTEVPSFAGYQVVGRRVEFLGICPNCQKTQKSNEEHGS